MPFASSSQVQRVCPVAPSPDYSLGYKIGHGFLCEELRPRVDGRGIRKWNVRWWVIASHIARWVDEPQGAASEAFRIVERVACSEKHFVRTVNAGRLTHYADRTAHFLERIQGQCRPSHRRLGRVALSLSFNVLEKGLAVVRSVVVQS